jgi:tetratricopeptide (TPR) repeat protein
MDDILEILQDSFKTDERILKLYHELFIPENKRLTNLEIIDKYEQHLDLFQNKEFDPKIQIYKAVIRINSAYANALKSNGNVRKAIPFLSKAISLFDEYSKAPDKEKIESIKSPSYELLRWNRGHSYFLTKSFDLALEDFRFLSINFPENEKYKVWIRGAELRKRREFEGSFLLVLIIGIVLKFIFFWHAHPSTLNYITSFLLIGAWVLFMGFNIWNWIEGKKIEKYFDSKL